MKKVLALFLCLVLILIPLSSVATFADPPAEGYELDGTTYTVYTADGLVAVAALIQTDKLDYNITLAADIDMTGKAYTPITNGKSGAAKGYTGTIDGAGFKIIGFGVDNVDTRFFGLVSTGGPGMTVQNLTFQDPNFNMKDYGGCIVGRAYGDFTVSNCHIRGGVIQSSANYVGGFAGRCESGTSNVLFENCTVKGLAIEAVQSAALLLGGESGNSDLTITFRNIVAEGSLNDTNASTSRMAGLVGYAAGLTLNIENCICLPTFDHVYTDYASFAGVANNATINYTNCIGNTAFSGTLTSNSKTTTVISSAIYDKEAIADRGEAKLYQVNVADNGKLDTLIVDSVTGDILNAKLPVVAMASLQTMVNNTFAGDFLAKAQEVLEDVYKYAPSGLTLKGYQQSLVDGEKNTFSVRFVATIATEYDRFDSLGFDVAYTAPDSTAYAAQEVNLSTVYASILANEDGNMVTHTAAELDGAYIAALILEDVPAVGTCIFTVTPFVKAGETKLAGTTYAITFTDGAFVSSTPVVGGI